MTKAPYVLLRGKKWDKERNLNPLARYIIKRIKRKKDKTYDTNFLAIFTGEPGLGKTYAALRLAEMLDKNFTIKQIVFKFEDLVALVIEYAKELENSKYNGYWKNRPRKVIIFEEAQEDMNSASWQSANNKRFNKLLSSWRTYGFIVLFTSPEKTFIDKRNRTLLHMEISMKKKIIKDKITIAKPKFIVKNFEPGHFLQMKVRGTGELVPYESLISELPKTEGLIDEYENMKRRYVGNNGIVGSIWNEIQAEKKEVERKNDPTNVLTTTQKDILKKLAEGLKQNEIAELRGISPAAVCKHVSAAEAKGFTKDYFLETKN